MELMDYLICDAYGTCGFESEDYEWARFLDGLSYPVGEESELEDVSGR